MRNLFKNRIVIGAICIALAIIVGFVVVPVVNALTSSTVEVVRVNKDISMGTQITTEMLELVEVGKLNLPTNIATDFKQVEGLYFTTDLKAGDYILASKVTDRLVLPENKIRQMKQGEASYTIKLGNAYLSKLLPNDIVTFYSFNDAGEAVVVKELEYVSVVTTTTSDRIDILTANQVAADGSVLVPNTITFILSDVQVQKLMTLEHSGGFKIALEYRGDSDAVINDYLAKQEQNLHSLSNSSIGLFNDNVGE